jgi:hypothetical protein
MEKERLMLPSAKMALRLRLSSSYWSWSLPSSREEALFLLHRCVNIFGYVSNMDKGISFDLKTKSR